MVTEIPAEVRRPIDDETARRDVITPEITSTRLCESAYEHCAAENQRQNGNFCEAVFCFHADILIIELAFGQQVAVGRSENVLELLSHSKSALRI